MKNKIAILSSLLCMLGTTAGASDCNSCGLNTFETFESFEGFTTPEPVWPDAGGTFPLPQAVDIEYERAQIPMRQVKMLTVKPVEADDRPALWDGTHGKYVAPNFTKTVDGRTGVPLWDDSIADYKSMDFSDWMLEPREEVYEDELIGVATQNDLTQLYQQNMADAAETRARIDELLSAKQPTFDFSVFESVSITTDGCPFETEKECDIWRRKPVIRENVSPRSPKIRTDKMAEFLNAAECNSEITANNVAAAPLLARYKMLMNASNACCTDGMVYNLKRAGASDGLVYKFMSDDANFYGFGSRCLMMTDVELDTKYPNTATAVVAADVRNGCLCRGREWFTAMLAPFVQAYQANPEFRHARFDYTYVDGLGRQITVSVNQDVQNILKQIEMCP